MQGGDYFLSVNAYEDPENGHWHYYSGYSITDIRTRDFDTKKYFITIVHIDAYREPETESEYITLRDRVQDEYDEVESLFKSFQIDGLDDFVPDRMN